MAHNVKKFMLVLVTSNEIHQFSMQYGNGVSAKCYFLLSFRIIIQCFEDKN